MEHSYRSTKALTVQEMTAIALSAVLIAVCSWITIPAGPVPFTLQTFAVFIVVGILGWKLGALAVLLYILLGAVGLPVFSGFGGGIGKLAGPTGGYIIGFLALCAVYGLICKVGKPGTMTEVIALACGTIACYTFGTIWFMFVYTRNQGPITLGTTLSLCVLPFLIPDAIKLAVAVPIGKRIRRALGSYLINR